MIEVRKIIKIENGREVLLAEYLVEELNDYKRNPLIKVLLPILSYEESFNQLCYLPEYHPNKKNLSIHLRYHALLRLTRFFQPVNQTLSLEVRLSRFIRDGYVYGNPLQKQHVQTLKELQKKLVNNEEIGLPPDIRNSASSFTLIGFSGIG